MEIDVNTLIKLPVKDEIIAFQTDTVYGVGCKLSSKKGVEKIYAMKHRDTSKPLPVLVASIEDAIPLIKYPKRALDYMNTYWPGGLTLVSKKTDVVPDFVTKGLPSVGVRMPNDSIALKILQAFGPMAVTSLNISSEPAVLLYKDAKLFINDVDYLVKGENLSAISSTVFDVDNRKILRQGVTVIKR